MSNPPLLETYNILPLPILQLQIRRGRGHQIIFYKKDVCNKKKNGVKVNHTMSPQAPLAPWLVAKLKRVSGNTFQKRVTSSNNNLHYSPEADPRVRIMLFLAPRFILGIEENLLVPTAGLIKTASGLSEFGPPGPLWIT